MVLFMYLVKPTDILDNTRSISHSQDTHIYILLLLETKVNTVRIVSLFI